MKRSPHQPTKFYQKIFLLFLGCVLTILILEAGLRIGGAVFSLLQESSNKATFDRQEFRILCIGESTTALGGENSYPSQLEQILNRKQSRITFKVINKGLVSKTSSDILARLPRYLQTYRPQAVVAMIGINDSLKMQAPVQNRGGVFSVFSRWRTCRLLQYLKLHITAKMREWRGGDSYLDQHNAERQRILEEEYISDAKGSEAAQENIQKIQSLIKILNIQMSQEKNIEKRKKGYLQLRKLRTLESYYHVHLGWFYRMHKRYPEAEEQFEHAIQLDPDNYGAYVELARSYAEEDHCDKALPLLNKAVTINTDTVLAHMEMARCYEALGREKEAKDIYEKVFEQDTKLFKVDGTIGKWLMDHNYLEEAEVVLQESVKEYPDDFLQYEQLAQLYRKMGDGKKARQMAQKAKALREEEESYLPVTVRNYREIARMILDRRVRLFCMQYPLRNVGPLKEIFSDQRDIVFLENKQNFENELLHGEYNEIFSDSFAGNFGHCTPKGNRLIAENVAQAILAGTAGP